MLKNKLVVLQLYQLEDIISLNDWNLVFQNKRFLYFMYRFSFFFLAFFLVHFSFAQDKQYKVGCIGFYNFENLFDTTDDPDINDEEFLPTGGKQWTKERYNEKLGQLAKVVSSLGTELSPDGAAILGVAEIENKKVLEDFAKTKAVADRNYQVVHYDSPDKRGIDVALLYQPKYFEVTNSKAIPLIMHDKDGERKFTRDILLVSGNFDGEPIHVLVNHWSSRRGGAKATAKYRNKGAAICKAVTDSLVAINPNAKVFVMGDLNDDPTSPSVKKHLEAQRYKKAVKEGGFYNPWENYYRKGIGTLAYRDAWSLFDQIIVSEGAIDKSVGGYQFYKAQIFNEKYLVNKSGQFKGYPFRTFVGNTYQGGYSDHFPVYMFLVKEI